MGCKQLVELEKALQAIKLSNYQPSKGWKVLTNHQNDKKFGPALVKLQALYTERCSWDNMNISHKNPS